MLIKLTYMLGESPESGVLSYSDQELQSGESRDNLARRKVELELRSLEYGLEQEVETRRHQLGTRLTALRRLRRSRSARP